MIATLARPVALAALLAALPAAAQETQPATEAPAAEAPATGDLPLGEEVGGIGSVYVASTHGDWELRCVRTEDGADPCQLNQLLTNPEGGSMAEITLVNLPEGGEAVAGATIVTPLETLLTQAITVQVKGRQAKRYPFTFCSDIGCVARVGFTEEDLEGFRKGAEAEVTIFSIRAPNQPFPARMSLKGFTAGYAAMVEANAKVTAPAEGQ